MGRKITPDRQIAGIMGLSYHFAITANCSTEGANENFLFGIFFKEFPKSQSVLHGFG
jgi:hypothetical protein